MSGASYGYRYIRKTEEALAAYIINEAEASVVRHVYEMYTVEGLSIAEITRWLNREGIPPRRGGRFRVSAEVQCLADCNCLETSFTGRLRSIQLS